MDQKFQDLLYLKIPCITIRNNTERPETVKYGTNVIAGTSIKNLKPIFEKLHNNKWKKGTIPKFWDGKTSKRIVDILIKYNS